MSSLAFVVVAAAVAAIPLCRCCYRHCRRCYCCSLQLGRRVTYSSPNVVSSLWRGERNACSSRCTVDPFL